MEISNEIMSDIIIHTKYAKYKPELKRREIWSDIVDREEECFINKYPAQSELIKEVMKYQRAREVLGSMRMAQFAGVPVERNNSRVYNCAYHSTKEIKFFSNTMFLLLGGSGVGFSVQHRHIDQLPDVAPKNTKRPRKFLVSDTIEGWGDAVKVIINHYLKGTYKPKFDFSDIREKGMPLITAGGKAPGPEPLRTCLSQVQGVLENKKPGERLTSVECADIVCYIADSVYAGGIRRAALICLFDMNDDAMLGYKMGNFIDSNPQRQRVNVSAVALRKDFVDADGTVLPKTTKKDFYKFWDFTVESQRGEPAVYWTNDPDVGTNPCCEIALRDKQFCNLTTINYSTIENQEDLLEKSKAASILGTLQAGFTDFHYLGDEWISNCEEEALLGVSVTGIADGNDYKNLDWNMAASNVTYWNRHVAKLIGIKPAARTTCIKPEGTSSLVLGTASGVHGRHAAYYLRRVTLDISEPIAQYLMNNHPEIVEKHLTLSNVVYAVLPQKSPEGSIYRTESPMSMLERVKFFSENWINPGHVSGANTHNVSCTISVKPEEWEIVGEWMWNNKAFYNGISVMPYHGGLYKQAPFEDCTKAVYDKMFKSLKNVDLTKVIENEDNTVIAETLACAGGGCEI